MSIIGFLGADAETKQVGENKVHTFSVGTTYVTGQEKKEKPIFLRCELWGKGGDHPAAQFLKKGKQVSVEAFYDTSESEGDSGKQYYHIFKVQELLLL